MDQWKDGSIDLTKGSIHLHGGRGLCQDLSFASWMDGWMDGWMGGWFRPFW